MIVNRVYMIVTEVSMNVNGATINVNCVSMRVNKLSIIVSLMKSVAVRGDFKESLVLWFHNTRNQGEDYYMICHYC